MVGWHYPKRAGHSATTVRGLRLGLVVAIIAGYVLTAAPAFAVNGSFTSFSPPLTGSQDFVTGLGGCSIGPVGTRVESTRVFVVDLCNATLYRFPAGGGDASDLGVGSAANGFDGGITKLGSVYYGVIQTGSDAGVWTFDPTTLAKGTLVVSSPGGFLRDIVADAVTGEIWASTSGGIYRMNPTSSTPTLATVVAGVDADGLGISGDGKTIYAAELDQSVHGYDATTGAEVLDVSIPGGHGVDGIATTQNGDIFVNANDGTIERIDHATHAVTVVASGGSRGDFVTVGPDGTLYATQSDRVVKLTPSIFIPAPTPAPTPTHAPSPTPTATLPVTGSATGPIAAVAIGVIGLGAVLLLLARRRRNTSV
jgi:LPXTG-motif cell wall-anchored protein